MITLTTIILPRLEVPYLKEWIDHNLVLGVDCIKIYDNGEHPIASHDAHWIGSAHILERETRRTSTKDLVWAKKPHLDYHDDIPYAEIQSQLHELVDSYENVFIVPWICGVDHEYGYPESQKQMLSREINSNTGWLLNMDPDEFLKLPGYDNLQDLISHYSEFNHFYFGQSTGEERKLGTPIKELNVLEGFEPRLARKWMCDLDRCKSFVGDVWDYMVHNLEFGNPVGKTLEMKEAYFIHYKKELNKNDKS